MLNTLQREKKKWERAVGFLDSELGPAPVPPLVVVADGAIGLEAEPLRDGLVLLLLDGQRPLGAESLL